MVTAAGTTKKEDLFLKQPKSSSFKFSFWVSERLRTKKRKIGLGVQVKRCC